MHPALPCQPAPSHICKDSELVSYIAERYMLDYERQGRLKNLVMLRNLQDDMLISPHLLFLGEWGYGSSAAVGLSVLVTYLYCNIQSMCISCCVGVGH